VQAEIDSWDRLAHLLGPDGPVRAKLAECGGSIDADLSAAWGCAVEARADGEILYNGRPIELVSYSEQWRASMLVADMLARTAGTGFIVLDQLDSLDQTTRQPLVAWASRYESNGYQTILLLKAEAHSAPVNAPAWLKVRQIGNGKGET